MEKPEITNPELEAHAKWEPVDPYAGYIVAENLQGETSFKGDDFVAENEED